MIRFGLLKTSSFGKKNLGKLCLIFILVISMMLVSCEDFGHYTVNYTYDELSSDLVSIDVIYYETDGGKLGEAVFEVEILFPVESAEEKENVLTTLSRTEFYCAGYGPGLSSSMQNYLNYGIMLSYSDKRIVFGEGDIFILDNQSIIQGPHEEQYHYFWTRQDELYLALLDKYLSDERVVKPSETAPSSDFAA